MKQKEVFKKIGGIIQELSEQYDYLQTVADNLNDLELELFVANAHFLTDHIEILCKLNLQNKPKRPVIEKPATDYQQKFFEPVVQQLKPSADIKELKKTAAAAKPLEIEVTNKETEPELPVEKPAEREKQPEERTEPQFDFSSQAPEDTYSFVREEPETIRHELILDEAETWEEEGEAPLQETATDAEKKEEAEPFIVAGEAPELPEPALTAVEPEEIPASEIPAEVKEKEPAKKEEEEVVTRNQKISSQLGDKVLSKTEQLSIKPISDIKLAITLNDKLLYVKDLFNGYNLAYSEAIEILNRFNTFEEAQRFLKTNYVTKNNWEGKAATAEKFYALLRRRYA